MRISEIFEKQERTFSFEFFPPKNFTATIDLGINVGQLLKLNPSFISVTYGAGGSTQNQSFDLLDYLENKIGLTTMAHYTCVGANKAKIEADMQALYDMNVENLMLLRGDPPKGAKEFPENPDGFNNGSDLVSFVKKQDRFCIGAGAYPEGHIEADSLEEDLKFLKKKFEAGSDFLVTQMFFDNDYYFDFLQKTQNLGINCRIIPGLIPITNFKQIKRFAKMSGAKVPQEIVEKMQPYQDSPKKIYQIGVDLAIEQCEDLLEKGAPGIHFYTLNKSRATVDIFESLSKKSKEMLQANS